MAYWQSDECEVQLSGVSEAMDLLQIDVEAQVVEGRQGRQEATCSVSCFIRCINCLVYTVSAKVKTNISSLLHWPLLLRIHLNAHLYSDIYPSVILVNINEWMQCC